MTGSTIKNVLVALFLICALLLWGLVAIFFSDNTEVPTADDYLSVIEESEVLVHFIDVGQGDCAVIQTPQGNILIDAGTPDSKNSIVKYIDSIGVKEFEYAIFTHPHSDHIGSAADLVEKYNFKNVILPNAVSTTIFYSNLLDALEKEQCNVILGEAGKSFMIGDALIEIFAPRDYYYTDDLNDMSIVAKLTYGEVSFLFTGDAESFSERQMLKYNCDLDVDVLKVGHHGSSTSSSKDFMAAVSPRVAIVSAGKDNEYGHPHRETVDILKKSNTDMYITYECGNIVVSTDGTTFTVSTEK